MEAVAGRDLDWFWYPFWYTTAALDQAITEVQLTQDVNGGSVARVGLANLGDAFMPVNLVLTLLGGDTIQEVVPVDVWLTGATEHSVTLDLPSREAVIAVEIDPESAFPMWIARTTSGSRDRPLSLGEAEHVEGVPSVRVSDIRGH